MSTNTLKNRVLSVLLVLVMVVSILPIQVLGADGGAATVITSGGEVAFNVYKDAVAYANQHDGSTIKLQSDIDVQTYEDPADMPSITGNVTLDLNGKSINCVDVGSVSFDEEGEIVKDKAGTLTVTGSGSIGLLTMYCGALTLNSGTVEELRAEDFAVTVHITGGTVESLVLSLRWDDNATADISGGSVQKLDLGTGTVNITDGSHGSETAFWGVNGGTLNISGGSFSTLRLLVTSGKIHLTGGEFEYISTDPQAPFSEYQKLTMGSLLGDSCAFYSKDGSLVSADVLTLENVKVVADHEHTYKDGKCTTCGALCKHDRVDTAMGRCEVCGIQLEAEISAEGASPVFYTSFTQAWDALQPNRSDQVTVTLLKPRYDLGETDLYVKTNNIRLDLNSNVMFGTGKIVVSGARAVFTVENGDMNEITVEAADGAVTVGEDCGSIKAVRVTSTDAAVTIQSGSFEKLVLPATDTESLKNVKLSGGEFDSISFNGTGTVAITDMLEAGYAFQDNKGTASGQAGALVPYGMSFDAKTYFADLEVVKCGHSVVNEVKGYCNYCGKLYAGKITDKDGAVRYVESLQNSDFGNGNTVTLLQDITGTVTPGSSCTIELRGRSVGQINFAVQDGTLTLKGQGKIGTVTLGSGEIDSTLAIEDTAYWQRVQIGTLTINKTTNTKLSGGQFDKIERKDGGFVEALLADGYAYFDREWDMPEYVGGKTSLTKTYYIAEHSHWFIVNIEGETQCQECGMPCHHTTIGEDGKCQDVCHRQIYTAVLTRADGTAKNYESFADAWTAAMADSGSTLRLLCDVTLGEAEDGIIAGSGKFTLDLGGKTISGTITNQLLTVKGTADITVKNGALTNTFSDNSGKVELDTANALKIEGGAVTLEKVKLTSGRGDQGGHTHAVLLLDGSLTVLSGTFNGELSVERKTSAAQPVLKITEAALNDGISYSYIYEGDPNAPDDQVRDYAAVKAIFADGSMLFEEDGRYIDVTDEDLWSGRGTDGVLTVGFSYGEACTVKPHTHDTFVDGKCAQCGYACPHDSGKNDREASYFQKAVCSLCRCEYGDYVPDTTAPTGEIKVKDRTWWESLLHTISFGLFFKEKVTVQITADDDGYTQPGYDESKHAVKIEYFLTIEPLTEERLKKCVFNEYDEPFELTSDNQYVIYAKLTDYAGNVTYASSEGFVLDTTLPVIENMTDGGHYDFCNQTYLKISDKNIDKVTVDGWEETLDSDGQLRLRATGEEQTVVVTDKAGNTLTVYVTVHTQHEIDETTRACRYCGVAAAIQVTADGFTGYYATLSNALSAALYSESGGGRENVVLTMLRDLPYSENGSDERVPISSTSFTIDLNGFTLSGGNLTISAGYTGTVTIMTSKPGGVFLRQTVLQSSEATLIMGEGLGGSDEVSSIFQFKGTLKVYHGKYSFLQVTSSDEKTTELYGGSFWEVMVQKEGMTCADLLAPEHRYEGISYADAKAATKLTNVTVVPCAHATLDENGYCADCGFRLILAVEVGGVSRNFQTFESAIRYAEANTGSTMKLLRDLQLDTADVGGLLETAYGYVELTKGTYTLDLAGKTLAIGFLGAGSISYVKICNGCDLTIVDSVGGAKVTSGNGAMLDVRSDGHLTIESGDYSAFGGVMAEGPDSLTLKGGQFKQVISREGKNEGSPLRYLADGYAFKLTDSGAYAGEKDVESQVIPDRGTRYWIEKVSVVPAPVVIPTGGQPQDITFYLTSPNSVKHTGIVASYVGEDTDKKVTITLEKADGTVIDSNECDAVKTISMGFGLEKFTAADSGEYRIKVAFDGYTFYSNTFTVTVLVCDHPGYDETTNRCARCFCDLAAVITKDGQTKGYVTFAEALAAAQTDANSGCTLKLLDSVSGTVVVKSGKFTLDAANFTIGGKLNIAKGADLTVSGGTVTGNVVCAKDGKLAAERTAFTGNINCVGGGIFSGCKLGGTVSGKSSLTLTTCEITGALSISGFAKAEGGTVSGEVTVNNGGSLRSYSGTYKNSILLKSGGTLDIAGGTYNGRITTESGSTLTVSKGTCADLYIEKDVTARVSGGQFTNITVQGKSLNDCLTAGLAYEEIATGTIIDGRVAIAGNVKVVRHTHTCVWKSDTHEKLCGCGYVEAKDTEAPVITGIKPDDNNYGTLKFTVTDANDFTVWMDGQEITLVNGKYTMEPDNETHLITATDVAGNTVSFRFGLFKTYHVTLPTGAGYIIHSRESTVRHGDSYDFIVEFNNGYSRTEDFKVLVNGNKLDELSSDRDIASFVVRDVSEDLVITVEGVADITPPDVKVTIHGNAFKDFLNRITFGLFFKENQTVEVRAVDDGSGIQKVEYLLSETAFTAQDAITGNWTELTLSENREAFFSITASQKVFVYVRVTDKSGNISVVNSDGVVVYTDAEAITQAVDFTRIDKTDVSFQVKLNGNTVSALYNGETLIDSALYTVSGDGTITLKNSFLSTLAAGEYNIRVAYAPLGQEFKEGDAPAMTSVKLTVSKQVPVINLEPYTSKIYDGKPIDVSKIDLYTWTDGARKWEFKPVDADESAYTTTAPKNAGKYNVRLTLTETENYQSRSVEAVYEIFTKGVTITGASVEATKVYDGETTAKITNSGTLSDNYDGENLTIVTGTAAYADKNVGKNKSVAFAGFTLGGSAAENYALTAQPESVTADITAKAVTIDGVTVEPTKVYDGTTAAKITNSGTLSANYDGENLTIVTGTAAYADKNVGIGKAVTFTGFTLGGSAAGNYQLTAQPEAVTADITAKAVTIDGATVEAAKVYDGDTAAKITNSGTLSANYDGENLTIVTGTAAYADKNVGIGKTVTFAGFTLGGSAAENYQLTAQPESVTADITAKAVTITGSTVEATKVYDGTTAAKITNSGTLSDNYDGEKLTIVTGTAAYADKNVGIGKTVTFTGFTLGGSAAGNYALTAQPEAVTADITAKAVTIDNLRIKDKLYDGLTTAEIDGTPTLVGLVEGDRLQLVCGTPTFDSAAIGKNIPVTFTAFALQGDSVTVGNYALTQPAGITGNIGEYIAGGSEYSVNSNDWLNAEFVVTANKEYLLSRTGAVDGAWVERLTAAEETAAGTLTFFVKDLATGAISAAVTEQYKIDMTAPTGQVSLNGRSAFQTVLNQISFGLFFRDEVTAELMAADDASGIRSVQYYRADSILSAEEVLAITDWTEGRSLGLAAEDAERFVIYVRVEDNAGNVTYLGSDGAVFDTAAPRITGVENGGSYYVTQKVTVVDENLAAVTVNGSNVESVFTLAGDVAATYVISAADKAGNVTEFTVTMQPISSITDAVADLTKENVKSSDQAALAETEGLLTGIDTESTAQAESDKLQAAAENCRQLQARIAEVAEEIARLTDAVNAYDSGSVTSGDKSAIEQLAADLDVLLNGDNLTDPERSALEELKAKALALLERIAAAAAPVESPEVAQVKDITTDNVTSQNKGELEQAERTLQEALESFDGNYTPAERADLEKRLADVKEALGTIKNVEDAAREIGQLPAVEDVKLSSKDQVAKAQETLERLTAHEKDMLGSDAVSKVNALAERIAELEKNSFDPQIIEGAGQVWHADKAADALFRSSAEFEEFLKVLVDGTELQPAHYTVYAGSTVVELKSAYLETLAAGEHTLSIVSQNGTATTTFTVERNTVPDPTPTPEPTPTPTPDPTPTGDSTNFALWIALLFVSGGVVTGTILVGKRRSEKE